MQFKLIYKKYNWENTWFIQENEMYEGKLMQINIHENEMCGSELM